MHGDLPGLGPEHGSLYAQDIADIILLESCIGLFAHVITPDIDLDIPFSVQQVREGSLAHHSAAGHAARDGYFLAFQFIKPVQDCRTAVRYIKPGDLIGVLPRVNQLLQFLPADNFLLGQRRRQGGYGIICHMFSQPLLTSS